MTRHRSFYTGLLAGLVAATADGCLIALTDPSASAWGITQAMLFWVTAGLAVTMSNSGLGDILHGVVATVVLCLPWYVNLAIAPGHPELVLPLLAMSIIFGIGFGWARRHVRRAPPAFTVRTAANTD